MTTNVTVGTSLTLLAAIAVAQAEVVTVHLKNQGDSALNAFRLKGKAGDGPNLGFVDIQTGSFTSPGLHCIYASSEPGVLASGAECILYLTPGFLQHIELWASVASGTADVVIDHQRAEG